jgi:N-acetylneuraminic acid mutarotase
VKIKSSLSFLLFVCFSVNLLAQGTWTQKANFSGGLRIYSVGFSIGNKVYIGTGYDLSTNKKDFWEWDQATNAWTQKANFGGTARNRAVGFSIGTKGYIGTGNIGGQEFWEWDQSSNIWTQKANFGGTGRSSAIGFSIGNNGYIGTGNDGSAKNDFWEWNQASNLWTQKANYPGGPIEEAASFATSTKGYICTGKGTTNNDLWEFNPPLNTWSQKASFPGTGRLAASGASDGTDGFICSGGSVTQNWITYGDFWRYHPANNTWDNSNAIPPFTNCSRKNAIACCIGNKIYFGTGLNALSYTALQDFWEFTPCSIPTPIVTKIADTLFCNTGFLTYQWYYSLYNIYKLPNATSPSYIPVTPGSYYVTVTNASCITSSNTITSTPSLTPIKFQKTISDSSGSSSFAVKCRDIAVTNDGGFIITGYGESYWPCEDIILIKTDGSGEVKWNKTFHSNTSTSFNSIGNSVIQTKDNGYIITGVTPQDGFCIIKTDSLGNKKWAYKNPNYTEGISVIQNKKGDYVAVGNQNNPDHIYLINIDNTGTLQWEKRYGDTSPSSPSNVEYVNSIINTSDGGYLITGGYAGSTNAGIVMKTDSIGNLLWTGHFSVIDPLVSF